MQAHHEATQQQREYDETKRQIEEDADREILDIKNKYERRLRDEIETNMRLKGESGIMRKKVGGKTLLDKFTRNCKRLSRIAILITYFCSHLIIFSYAICLILKAFLRVKCISF